MSSPHKPYDIVIFTKDAPFHNKALEGLYAHMDSLKMPINCHEAKIPAGNSWKEAEEVLNAVTDIQPNLIISIGALCSHATRLHLNKTGVNIPLLFGGVTMPSLLGLVSQKSSPHETSGISLGFASYMEAAEVFHYLKPDLKHILIPYSPHVEAGVLKSEALLIREYFERNKVETTLLEVYDVNNFIEQVSPFIKKIDSIMNLEGCITNDIDDVIINLCNENKITFFAGGYASSIQKGAAAGFVPDPVLLGSKLFEYVQEVVINNKRPSELPIRFLENKGRQVVVNASAAKRQNLNLSESVKYFLKFGRIIKNTNV